MILGTELLFETGILFLKSGSKRSASSLYEDNVCSDHNYKHAATSQLSTVGTQLFNPIPTHECSWTERCDTSEDRAKHVSCMRRYLTPQRHNEIYIMSDMAWEEGWQVHT